jgi:hypothetical protein
MTLPKKQGNDSAGIRFTRFNCVARAINVCPRTLTRMVERGDFPAPFYLGPHKVYETKIAEQAKRALMGRMIAQRYPKSTNLQD